MATKSFYDLEADLPKGDKLSMAQLKDKVVLIVNVASKVSAATHAIGGRCSRPTASFLKHVKFAAYSSQMLTVLSTNELI